MTTPTETGLLRYAKIDGKTFIVDAEGRTLGQVGPKEITREMAIAGRKACCAVADRMEAAKETAVSTIDFWQQVGHEPANSIYEAMLSAATVDVTGAVVKVELDSDDDIASLR